MSDYYLIGLEASKLAQLLMVYGQMTEICSLPLIIVWLQMPNIKVEQESLRKDYLGVLELKEGRNPLIDIMDYLRGVRVTPMLTIDNPPAALWALFDLIFHTMPFYKRYMRQAPVCRLYKICPAS